MKKEQPLGGKLRKSGTISRMLEFVERKEKHLCEIVVDSEYSQGN
jgi:hypothetical protein